MQIIEKVKRTEAIATLLRLANPSFSTCGKCKIPWNYVGKTHCVYYSKGLGTFAMCQYCWERSNLSEILTCWRMCYIEQKRQADMSGLAMLQRRFLR
jgi:hypothetical protein